MLTKMGHTWSHFCGPIHLGGGDRCEAQKFVDNRTIIIEIVEAPDFDIVKAS